MKAWLALFFYQLILGVACLLVAPFWWMKMMRRGGAGSGLLERVGVYGEDGVYEPTGVIYVHAVSVGEVLLALKLIEGWLQEDPEQEFVLVPTTATGMAVARQKARAEVRVIYSPLDFSFLIRRVLRRFEPRLVVLMESELWPSLILESKKAGVPVAIANARLSPRSARRLTQFRMLAKPIMSSVAAVGVPEEADVERWLGIGCRREAIRVTGNVKFDQEGAEAPKRRGDFAEMLESFGEGKKVIMALSTFAGEEEWLARHFLKLGDQVLPVIVPRHAERREDVKKAIEKTGEQKVVLRSRFSEDEGEVFVIDSTGELRDWTAHAFVAVIGKSFFAQGGQNPAEAITAGVPVICGPSMTNFEPLVTELVLAGGIWQVTTTEGIDEALSALLNDHGLRKKQSAAAQKILAKHTGALGRTIDFLRKF